jgi:hypothetical protein
MFKVYLPANLRVQDELESRGRRWLGKSGERDQTFCTNINAGEFSTNWITD